MTFTHESRVEFGVSPFPRENVCWIWCGVVGWHTFDRCIRVEMSRAYGWSTFPMIADIPGELAKWLRRNDRELKEMWVRDALGMVRWFIYEGYGYWREQKELRNDGLQYLRREEAHATPS